MLVSLSVSFSPPGFLFARWARVQCVSALGLCFLASRLLTSVFRFLVVNCVMLARLFVHVHMARLLFVAVFSFPRVASASLLYSCVILPVSLFVFYIAVGLCTPVWSLSPFCSCILWA